jgi:hypothetical protein
LFVASGVLVVVALELPAALCWVGSRTMCAATRTAVVWLERGQQLDQKSGVPTAVPHPG